MKKPVKILTLDTETYQGLIGSLKRIAIYDGEKVEYGYNFSDIEGTLIEYSQVYDVHVYIHNMEFDLRKIPEVFEKDRIEWNKCALISRKFAKVKCKHYTFHDSFKILPSSLHTLSKDFQVEHGKLDLWEEVEKRYPKQYSDLVDFLDRCDKDNSLFLEYLGYDVMSLYEVLFEFMHVLDMEQTEFVKKLSTASISRYIFKNGFRGKVFINETSPHTDYEHLCQFNWFRAKKIGKLPALEVEKKIRESYFGGRTEVFKPLLEKGGFHYDVNSLYPSCFYNQYPVGKPTYHGSDTAFLIWKNWLDYHEGLGFIKCRVFVPKQHIPPLPSRMGKLVFPCGEFDGTWTYTEMEYAVKECGVKILDIEEVIHFDKTHDVFARFVDALYPLKVQSEIDGNIALRTVVKLLLNTGYGYTGMRYDDKTALDDIENLEKIKEEIVLIDEELGFVEKQSEIKSDYVQVQVASYVTSYARLVLLKALRMAHEKGANVYYCDTDSIVTDKEFPSMIVDSKKLGYWDCENMPDKGIFIRPKVYAELFEEYTNKKFKGVTRETISNDFDFSTYKFIYDELCKEESDSIIVEKDRTMLHSLIVIQKDNLGYDHYELRDKKMNLKTTEKRVMNYKENYTEPLFFNSIDEFHDFAFKTKKGNVSIDLI